MNKKYFLFHHILPIFLCAIFFSILFCPLQSLSQSIKETPEVQKEILVNTDSTQIQLDSTKKEINLPKEGLITNTIESNDSLSSQFKDDNYNTTTQKTNIWFWVMIALIGMLSLFMFAGKKGR